MIFNNALKIGTRDSSRGERNKDRNFKGYTVSFITTAHKFLKSHQIRYYDPDNQYLRHAIHTALAVAIALIATHYWQWQEGAWLVLTSVFIMQTRLGDTNVQRVSLMAVTGVLTCIGVGLGVLAQTHWWAIFLLLGSFSFFMVMVGFWGQNYAIAGFFVNLLTVVSVGLPVAIPSQRVELVLLGTLNCLIIGFIPLTRNRYKLSAIRENFWRCCYSYWRIQTRNPAKPLTVRVYRMHVLMSLTKIHPFLPLEQQSNYSRIVELLLDLSLLRDKLPQHSSELLNDSQTLEQQLSLLLDPTTIPDKTAIMQSLAKFDSTTAANNTLSPSERAFVCAWQRQMQNLAQYIVELKTL